MEAYRIADATLGLILETLAVILSERILGFVGSLIELAFPSLGDSVLGTIAIIAIIVGLMLLRESRAKPHKRVRMHLGHLEGKLEGGSLTLGQIGPDGAVGVVAGKGTMIKKLKNLVVKSEGGKAIGLITEGKVGEIEGMRVEQHEKGTFWFWLGILVLVTIIVLVLIIRL